MTDTERLDFMIEHSLGLRTRYASLTRFTAVVEVIVSETGDEHGDPFIWNLPTYTNPREAIDATIEAYKKQVAK